MLFGLLGEGADTLLRGLAARDLDPGGTDPKTIGPEIVRFLTVLDDGSASDVVFALGDKKLRKLERW